MNVFCVPLFCSLEQLLYNCILVSLRGLLFIQILFYVCVNMDCMGGIGFVYVFAVLIEYMGYLFGCGLISGC